MSCIKYFNFTPNMITGINILCFLLCLYYLYAKQYHLGVLFLILTYLFDALDGFYARKYKMETYFGDLLDHYTDYVFYINLYIYNAFRLY
jgi:phosphatidylglycerophosphate synthase